MLDARCSMLDARYNDKSEFLVWILPWILTFTQITALTPPPCPVDLTEAALMLQVPGTWYLVVYQSRIRERAVTSALQKSFHESSRYFVSTQSTVHCLYQNGSIIFPSSGSEVSKACASYQQLFNKYVIQSWNIGWFLIFITRWLFREIRSDLISFHLIWSDLIWFHFNSSSLICSLFEFVMNSVGTRSKAYSILVRLVRCGKHARFIELWRLRWHKQTHIWLEKSLRGFFPLIENI